jgi:hypothetical protein
MEGMIIVAGLSTCIESSGEWLMVASDIATGEGAAGVVACDT